MPTIAPIEVPVSIQYTGPSLSYRQTSGFKINKSNTNIYHLLWEMLI